MSKDQQAIDLTADDVIITSSSSANETTSTPKNKKRKLDTENLPKYVWVAIHQLEAAYDAVGDFSREAECLSHCPTTFDATILGIFLTKAAANRCAEDHWSALGYHGSDEDEDEDEDEEDGGYDYEGEGKYYDARDSGSVNTFSERVFIKRQAFTHR
jgi:hypothetical protein